MESEAELFLTANKSDKVLVGKQRTTTATSSSFQSDWKYRSKMKNSYNYGLFASCMMFGMGAWLLINAVFSQMPKLVLIAPEGWDLPSYYSILVQLANVSPLLYSFLKTRHFYRLNDSTLIPALMALGAVSMFLFAFTYDRTDIIFGQRHSLCMFLFSFFMSMVGCTSSVLFIPFMNTLPEQYLIPYFVGEGVSGFLPSMIALMQGVQRSPTCVNVTLSNGTVYSTKHVERPRFSSTIFFLIIASFMTLSTVSFVYLSINSRYRKIKLHSVQTVAVNNALTGDSGSNGNNSKNNNNNNDNSGSTEFDGKEQTPLSALSTIPAGLFGTLLTVQLFVNVLGNGVLPSIESYSCLPYGNNAYHLAVNVGQIISPITFYVSMFLPLKSLSLLIGAISLCCICLIYQITTAFLSPNPPFVDSLIGIFLVVFIWVCSNIAISYVKISIATIFRKSKKEQALFYYGVVTQVGSAIGSLLSFYVINYTNLLHAAANENEQC